MSEGGPRCVCGHRRFMHDGRDLNERCTSYLCICASFKLPPTTIVAKEKEVWINTACKTCGEPAGQYCRVVSGDIHTFGDYDNAGYWYHSARIVASRITTARVDSPASLSEIERLKKVNDQLHQICITSLAEWLRGTYEYDDKSSETDSARARIQQLKRDVDGLWQAKRGI